MKKLVSLVISVALVAWAQSYSFERKFVVDALLLYTAGALVFVFGFLKREPLAPLLSTASEEAPSSLLWRPIARRRRLPIGLAVTAIGVALSAAAAYQFWQGTYPWPWMAAWAAGIVVALAGCFVLSPRGESTSEPPVSRLWETGLLVVILLVALAMRLYQIDAFPAGVYLDEADNALLGLQTASAPAYSPFTRVANGHPTLFLYFLGYALKAFGSTAFVLRLSTVFIGMVTVVAFYPLAKLMFGYRIGLALTFLLAVSRWHVNFSRISFDGIVVPLFVILTFYFLLKGLRTKRIWDFAWAGIAVAGGMNSYVPYRVIPVVVAVWLLALLIFWRPRLRGAYAGLVAFVLIGILASAPVGTYFLRYPGDFTFRAEQASVFLDMERQKNTTLWDNPIRDNFTKTLLMFNWEGDPRPRHNLPGEPELDFVTAIFFALGFAVALARFRHPRHLLLFLWLFAMFMPGVLSLNDSNPHSLRTIGNVPAAFLFAGVFLDSVWRAWPARVFGPKSQVRLGNAVAALLAVALFFNYNTFFNVQAGNKSVFYDFDPAQTEAAYLVRQIASTSIVYVSPALVNHPNLRFIPQGTNYQQLNLNRHIPVRDRVDRDVVFVLEPAHTSLLSQLKTFYPSGVAEEKRDKYGKAEFSVFRLSKQQVAEIQGLTARYYAGIEATGQPIREEKADAVALPGGGAIPAAPFTAEWTGALLALDYGRYTFKLDAAGNSALVLDDNTVIESAGGPVQAQVELPAGFHSITVRTVQSAAGGTMRLSWTPPGGREEVVPASALYTLPASRNGLLGRYYRGNNWAGAPATVRLDPFIDANDLLSAPFSIEWEGKINFPQSGSYAIGTLSDDGSLVFIDERLVVDNGGHHADRYVEARATFTEGLHNIRIRYNQDDGGRKLELWWTTPAGKRELIPVSVLFPPGITPTAQELASQPEPPRAGIPPQVPPPAPASPPVNAGQYLPKASRVWGTMGQDDGQFNEPRGIAVGRDGSVYVADAKNMRVERFDANGKFLNKFGQGGNGEAYFAEPFDIATDSAGNVYVVDSMSATIKKFSPDLKFQGLVPGNQGFYRPRGLGIDAQGNVYVADTGHNRVVKLSPAGQVLGTIGSQGPGKGQFDQPTDVAVDRDGSIYVTDTLNRRVQKLDARGAYVTEWPLSQANTFNSPHLVVGEKAVFVTEPERGRVAVFSTDGALIAEFGTLGAGENEMTVPLGIALDPQGNVYVTEVGNHRVHKFELAR